MTEDPGEEDNQEFRQTGKIFRRGRRHLDLTQRQMACYLNVSPTKISELESRGGQLVYRLAMHWMLEHPPELPRPLRKKHERTGKHRRKENEPSPPSPETG